MFFPSLYVCQKSKLLSAKKHWFLKEKRNAVCLSVRLCVCVCPWPFWSEMIRWSKIHQNATFCFYISIKRQFGIRKCSKIHQNASFCLYISTKCHFGIKKCSKIIKKCHFELLYKQKMNFGCSKILPKVIWGLYIRAKGAPDA